MIIQTEYATIFNIMQRLSIKSTSFIMKINVRLIRASQFFQQFCLIVWDKLWKELIIPDVLSRLANVNNASHNLEYSELNAWFIYHTILVEINLALVKRV